MVEMIVLDSREDWLEKRKNTIGGSDASAIIGLNPWKSNVDLWLEKTGQTTPEDISDKACIQYGSQAEMHLRGLFRLDYPQFKVEYVENNLYINSSFPWGHYSADGWLFDENGRLGILEIKTTEILRSMQKEKWNNQIPDNYYIQLLHGMMIMEADFAVLKAQLKTVFDGVPYLQTKHYVIERAEVEGDIQILADAERDFWKHVVCGTKPALLLPEI